MVSVVINGTTATITGTGASDVVPTGTDSQLNGITDVIIVDVGVIDVSAFLNATSVIRITIPAMVTKISLDAFNGCTSLSTMTFEPNSQLTEINGNAFRGCISLTSMSFESNSLLSIIGQAAFTGCISLASINIPDEVLILEPLTFFGCTTLNLVTFSSTSKLNTINSQAFVQCTSLASITIPKTVNKIESQAFQQCSNLVSVTFETGSLLTSIGSGVFQQCVKLASFIIPDGVTTIKSATFFGCSDLASITIPPGVNTIEPYAFYNCSKLASVVIPVGVSSIREGTFFGCSELLSINIPDIVNTIEKDAFDGCAKLSSVIFGENSQLTTIGDTAFRSIDILSIIIPSSVNSIGTEAFKFCSKLKSVNIPAGVVQIKDGTFFSCIQLDTVTFASNSQLNSIGVNAFKNCSSLLLITIPEDVVSIDSTTFTDSGLANVNMYKKTMDVFQLVSGPTQVFFGANNNNTFVTINQLNTPLIAQPNISTAPICFPKGTPVTTNQGLVAIEKLNPDIHTIRNKQIVAITQTKPIFTHIVSIEKDALGKNIPNATTQISKEHCVFYKGKMMRSVDLIKICKGVTEIPYNGEILYNVLLEKHGYMMINNLICETLHPENIMAKICSGKYNTTEQTKLYKELSKIIKDNNISAYKHMYNSLK